MYMAHQCKRDNNSNDIHGKNDCSAFETCIKYKSQMHFIHKDVRRLTAKSRENAKPRVWMLQLSYRCEIWHPKSAAAELPVEFQGDWKCQSINMLNNQPGSIKDINYFSVRFPCLFSDACWPDRNRWDRLMCIWNHLKIGLKRSFIILHSCFLDGGRSLYHRLVEIWECHLTILSDHIWYFEKQLRFSSRKEAIAEQNMV